MRTLDQLTESVIGAAIDIHRALGPGLLESAYEDLMALELQLRGIPFMRQCPVHIEYKSLTIRNAFRVDLLADTQLPIELKCTERLSSIHERQLLTYLRVMHLPIGLLINFGQARLVDGVSRVINNHCPLQSMPIQTDGLSQQQKHEKEQ